MIKPITFKLNDSKSNESAILEFLVLAKKLGYGQSFMCKLSLSYLKTSIESGHYEDSSGMITELVQALSSGAQKGDKETPPDLDQSIGFSSELFKPKGG